MITWNKFTAGGTMLRAAGFVSLYERDGVYGVLGPFSDGDPIVLETTVLENAVAEYERRLINGIGLPTRR